MARGRRWSAKPPNDGREMERADGAPSPQSLMRLVEDQAQVGVWWHDIATGEITVSQGLARISGIPATVPRTRDSMMRHIHPQDRVQQDDQMALVDIGQPLRREYRMMRPDGTIRWVSSRIDIILDDDGRPVRSIGVVVDITERREAQRAAEFNQGRRAALLEATSALTWISDPSGRSTNYSAWCELTGMAEENCADSGWLDAVHPNDRDRVAKAYRTALSLASVYDADYRVLTRAGTYRWFNARSVPVRDAAGTVQEWQGVLLPIDGAQRPVAEGATSEPVPALTGPQIRGARGLLDWSLAQLAAASGVSVSTIKRMEDGSEGTTRASKSDAVRQALQGGGIAFRTIDGATWISR